jgi:glucosamine-6-phosphate deaminase
MDEYLDEGGQFIPTEDPLSFRSAMRRCVYDAIRPELTIPADNRWFPTPGQEERLWERICDLGGVDVCYGGIGINGHIAFNESADPSAISTEAFAALPTRALCLSRETIAVNSRACLGEMPRMPRRAMTIGMREILSARRIVIHAGGPTRVYQMRRAMCGGVTPAFPVSYLQGHHDATLFTSADALAPLRQFKGYLGNDEGARDALGRSVAHE